MIRRYLLLAIPLLALVVTACVPAPPGMTSHAFEEFLDDSAGLRRWKVEHSTYGDGNHELQHYRPENVVVSDGTMKITAKRESYQGRRFTSAFIGSRQTSTTGTFYPKFGRYEMRARLPHGQGLWPAFWLRRHGGANHAEVDVMEYFHASQPGQTQQTLHLDGVVNTFRVSRTFESPRPDRDTQFHTWAVEIVPEGDDVRFTFFLDGSVTGTYVDTDPAWNDPNIDPDHFWDVAVNLAVGGDWAGDPDDPLGHLHPDGVGQCSIGWTDRFTNFPDNCPQTSAGHSIRRAQFPAVMEVDYVRIFRWTGDT